MKPYYERDGITIYHGDCRDVMDGLGLSGVDMVLTDPPYAISVAGSEHVSRPGMGARRLDFFRGDSDWRSMTALVAEAVEMAMKSMSDRASIYVWCGHRQFGPLVELIESRGLSSRFVVWRKECPPPAPPGSGWSSAAELCVYGYPAGRTWNAPRLAPNVIDGDSYRHGQPGKVAHPTQKSLPVIATLIDYSSNAGDTIFDPFMGSGTTLRAAKDLGRKAIGIEIEERYCEIAAKRLAQGVLFAAGGE